ncbi:glycoside hydrolase family 13 protein [Lacticaseibacillus porcinae]|uniref:glycoside hydrolase family 13 protein n=1 Tax=Lacticaseibacillus porcinae TaxID=1123687 RepID=UPI000F7B5423|nr:glycoside hydrolase family 13 protein [Lacticaseibacillus porcinae]
MLISAMAHRPESEDCFLIDAHQVRLRFKTALGDVQNVTALYGDPYWNLPDESGEYHFTYSKAPMIKVASGQTHDYWAVTLKPPYQRIQYLFAATDAEGKTVLFGDRGPREDTEAERIEAANYFRLPYFHEIDRTKTPAWVSETVWYQIFPERFANGDPSLNPENCLPWQPEDHPGRDDYYGGDLQGVLDHLDDLQDLGVNGLYFCPIFKASSNHKYDTIDYLEIDPAFGDKALFAKLVHEAHARGMRVMLDAVFNHMGYASMQWQDVLQNGQKSRFVDWFHIHDWPLLPYRDPTQGQGDPQFDTFAFGPGMPKLNTANPEVQAYLLEIATYWVKQFDIDAWRLDVANEVDHHFWRQFHDALIAIKPDFYILGEVWHSSQPWLNGDEFSGVMNYAFTQQIEDHFLTGVSDAQTMLARLSDQLMLYRDNVNAMMLNMLDSHDTPRLLTVAGGDLDRALQALAFTFLQTGTPCIYYGTEMGMFGGNDPDDRKPMDWSKLHQSTWQRVHALVALRREYAELLGNGTTTYALTDAGLIKVTRQLAGQTLVGYFNTTDQGAAIAAQPLLQQGFEAGILSPKGFIVRAQ